MASIDQIEDPEIAAVRDRLYQLDPTGERIARVIRDTYDQLYDGQRTGHWHFSQLSKTEKTHMGTLIEINLQREFKFDDGDATDYRIAGVQVDCKYSMRPGGWALPPEIINHLALLIWANDDTATWTAGLVRVDGKIMNLALNRDRKGTLSALGRTKIMRLWPDHGRLAPNLFISLDPATRASIFNAQENGQPSSGQARVNELFRRVQQRIIRRAEIATVAQQEDFMKRARENGGARSKLRPEGILILGHMENEPVIADQLGLPAPKSGELISVRVKPTDQSSDDKMAAIGTSFWTIAKTTDSIQEAPSVPKKSAQAAINMLRAHDEMNQK
nr:NaeI family type II restriction endonuclease [Kineosporia mesophila]